MSLTIGKSYEKVGQCEGCHVDGEALFRRTLDGRKVAMAPSLCKGCFVRLEGGILKKYCPLCTCELTAEKRYECGFCRMMGLITSP